MTKIQKLIWSSTFAVSLLLFVPAIVVGVTGCKATPTREAIIFNTFKSSWTVSKAAYAAWSERVVQGKATPEAEAKADKAWNNYRAAFKTAFILSSSNWSAATPATLNEAEKQLLALLSLLSK